MEKVFHHEIVYDFDDTATIDEIAAAMVANARFVKDAVAVIQACHPGLEISDLKIRLASITQQSPMKELLTAALVLGFQQDLEDEVPDFIKAITGIDVPSQYDSMVTIFVVGVSLYGALRLVDRITKDRNPGKLEDAYTSVTNVAGDLIQVSADTVAAKMEERLGGARSRAAA